MFNAEIVDAEAHVFCARVLTILRVFLALGAVKSDIRREELLVPQAQLRKMYVLRRILNPMDGIEFLLDKLRQTKTNGGFFNSMNAWHGGSQA
jgi:transcription termination factor Rho